MYLTFNSINNLSSYCGLVDAKIRASDKDLPVAASIPPTKGVPKAPMLAMLKHSFRKVSRQLSRHTFTLPLMSISSLFSISSRSWRAMIKKCIFIPNVFLKYYSEVPNKSFTFSYSFLGFFPTYMVLLGPTRLFIFGKSCHPQGFLLIVNIKKIPPTSYKPLCIRTYTFINFWENLHC